METEQNPVTREELARLIYPGVWTARWSDYASMMEFRQESLMQADAIMAAFTVLHPVAVALDPEPWVCEHCGSIRWVGWAAGPGWPRKAQCVPCGWIGDLPANLADYSPKGSR
jgi:hypothetical protein